MTPAGSCSKMAAVRAELRLKRCDTGSDLETSSDSGRPRKTICVKVENNLSSLISGIHEVNEKVSRVLSELVERERPHAACADREEEEEHSDDEYEDPQDSEVQPPVKRSKS